MNFLAPPKRLGERTASRNALDINHPLAESSAAARIPISMLPFVGGAASGYTQEDLATLALPEETTLFSPLGFDITDWDLARFGLATDAVDWVPGAAALGGLATAAGKIGRAVKGANYADTTGDALESMVAAGAARHYSPTNSLADMTAYHGSPYQFDIFDSGKMGTGEGAQAYGWGLYFAENPEVANSYARLLSDTDQGQLTIKQGQNIIAQGESIDDIGLETVKLLEAGANRAGEFKHNTAYHAKEMTDDPQVLARIDEWKDATIGYEPFFPNMYDVDIPDEAIAKMLDWDAPLSEQPESVRAALSAELDSRNITPWTEDRQTGKVRGMTGKEAYEQLTKNSGERLMDQGDEARMASEMLNELGIPGIKYYDGGSRSAGEGTRNFVVFDDKLPTILKRNGEPVNALAELPMDEASRMQRAQDMGFDTDAYHGSTRDITEFDSGLHGSAEGHYGAHNYFTSSTDDLANYAGEGPDLTIRIEYNAERIADDLDDYQIQEYFDGKNIEVDIETLTDSQREEAIYGLAKEHLGIENNGVSYPVKIKDGNLVNVNTTDETFFDFDSGKAIDLMDETRDTLSAWNVDERTIDEVIVKIGETEWDEAGIGASTFEDIIRNNVMDAIDDATGDMASPGAVIADIYKSMGFDGVRQNAEASFGTMDGIQGAHHYIMFDPKNIRSVNAAFDPAKRNSANMLATAAPIAATGLLGANALRGLYEPESTKQL